MAEKEPEVEAGGDVGAVREAAKWLITAFAAVGAALLAGIQFSEIGNLAGDALKLGIGGLALGLLGVGLAIGYTTAVLVTPTISLAALPKTAEKYIDAHPDIVGMEFKTLANFNAQRQAAWDVWHQAPEATRSGTPTANVKHVEQIATRIARFWRFEQVCSAFRTARLFSFIGAGLAGTGVVLFTIAAKKDDTSPYAKTPSAVTVAYQLTDTARETLLKHASAACVPATGRAIVLDGWPGGTDVLIENDASGCPPLRLRWSEALGLLQAPPEQKK